MPFAIAGSVCIFRKNTCCDSATRTSGTRVAMDSNSKSATRTLNMGFDVHDSIGNLKVDAFSAAHIMYCKNWLKNTHRGNTIARLRTAKSSSTKVATAPRPRHGRICHVCASTCPARPKLGSKTIIQVGLRPGIRTIQACPITTHACCSNAAYLVQTVDLESSGCLAAWTPCARGLQHAW